jgi:hypothetical protein
VWQASSSRHFTHPEVCGVAIRASIKTLRLGLSHQFLYKIYSFIVGLRRYITPRCASFVCCCSSLE